MLWSGCNWPGNSILKLPFCNFPSFACEQVQFQGVPPDILRGNLFHRLKCCDYWSNFGFKHSQQNTYLIWEKHYLCGLFLQNRLWNSQIIMSLFHCFSFTFQLTVTPMLAGRYYLWSLEDLKWKFSNSVRQSSCLRRLVVIQCFILVFIKSVDSNFRAFWLAPVTWNILGYSLFCERREKWREEEWRSVFLSIW